MKKSNLIRPITLQNALHDTTAENWFNYNVCEHILIPATYKRTQKGQYEHIETLQIKCISCEKMYTLRIAIN